MPKVLIAYKYVPQYRRAFFEKLRLGLAAHDIELNIVYGNPSKKEELRNDAVEIPWAIYRRNVFVRLGKRYLIYQPYLRIALKSDLVIVEQASRLLINPVLLAMQRLGGPRVAMWGHGKNFQNPEGPIARYIKQTQSRSARWWFAYNESSAQVMIGFHHPDARITRLMNTIDTDALQGQLADLTSEEITEFHQAHGITSQNVGLFVGAMYPEKRIPFLLDSALRIRKQCPDFQLVVIGSGEDERLFQDFARQHSWCRIIGPQFGRAKALAFKSSKVFLMPGLVGLAIIDTFAAQVPLITTCNKQHSPEIEYLQNGVNAVMVPTIADSQAYADATVALLWDDKRLNDLRLGCAKAASSLTIDAMVDNFVAGVQKALKYETS